MKDKPKVIIIGLDGATWDLIKPWAEEGKLPTFKKLMDEGAWGGLESTIPPVTFPAWQSLFTGMNPGKLGVFDFVQPNIAQRSYRINTPKSFHSKAYAIWNILSEFGCKSAVINVPTAQVASINGVMVGGPFSFGDLTYPHDFRDVLRKFSYEPYPLELEKTFLQGPGKPSSYAPEGNHNEKLEDIAKRTFDSRFKVAKYVLLKEKPDFLALVIFCIDNIQHFFWGEEIVENLWRYLDGEIEDFLAELDDNTYLILCSDHGFSKISKTFYISKYLERENHLRLRKSFRQRTFNRIHLERLIMIVNGLKLYGFIRKTISPEKLMSIMGNFPGEQGRIGASGLERMVEWENSKCIPLSTELYLNCSSSEKKQFVLSLIEELEQLEINGEKLIDHVYTKEQIYSGKYMREAPDLVLKPKAGVRVLESPFAKNMIEEGATPGGWKGEHTPTGMFLVTGPKIKKGKVVNTKIYDIMPTILRIFDLPIPPEIDGTVLKDIFH